VQASHQEYERVDEREAKLLAPYACFSRDSAGRHYHEPEHLYRGPYQRDRDRIVHSAAFRRLSGKMQVFTGDMGDYHRTRLTHTMEVASVARTIGRALRLNEDLIESLALLHDLGHPPFGHAGEDALNECLQDHGGFSHNQFALTLVQELEERYPDFPGLNLTREVLAGQETRVNKQAAESRSVLEVQVVEVADGIAYNSHDVDDALKLQLVTLEELANVPPLNELFRAMQSSQSLEPTRLQRQVIVRRLLDYQVSSVLAHCAPLLRASGWSTAADASRSGFQLEMQPVVAAERGQLAEFLYRQIYRHPRLLAVRSAARAEIASLHRFYVGQPADLPSRFLERSKHVGLARSAAEYIAGMTDRFCRERYLRLGLGSVRTLPSAS
jgi:dGTPase